MFTITRLHGVTPIPTVRKALDALPVRTKLAA